MWWARSVCEIRSSSLHFRIVFPGCSERVISPAIFSRSGNCMGRARKRAIYKRVEETIGVCRHRVLRLQTSNRAAIPLQLREKGKATSAPPSHNAYTSAYFSRAILGPWGSLVYPWWFGTTRLRFKSGRTHYGPRPRAAVSLRMSTQPIARSGGPGGPEHLPEGTRVVVALREPPGLLSRHPASDQGLTESLDASFPARLESEEPHAEAHGHDRDPRDQDDRQAGLVAGHQSPPSPRRPTAFAMIPPRFREDMYCSESLNACSSDIPLFLSVV